MPNSSVISISHHIPATWPLPTSRIFIDLCFHTCRHLPKVSSFCPISYLRIFFPKSSSSNTSSMKFSQSSSWFHPLSLVFHTDFSCFRWGFHHRTLYLTKPLSSRPEISPSKPRVSHIARSDAQLWPESVRGCSSSLWSWLYRPSGFKSFLTPYHLKS